ncbi:UNVERIFIED_CONTAM: hypothetical protein Slati_0925300 [Sesamum latifolium]|uniref:Aminotransferase-like plant mobile domain-containing protein n=1 Tax=Sesamum latifolium TaxID=2727402 RepID=A0AAW2XU63_9LAMI
MAAGQRVGLAVPVLASIYKSLNKISGSSRLIRAPSPFSIHFVYSWIAHYFKTHYQVLQGVRGPKMTLFSGEGGVKYYDLQEARKRIHKGNFVSWTCNMITKDKDFSFVDDGRAKDFEEAYFMAIRSNYLPLRQGDHFDVEPYSPHRFARQFGFFQEVPEILSQDVHRASLKDGICYWSLCISSKTMKKLEDEVLHIEDDKALQDSRESILGSNLLANTLSIGMGSKAKLPHHAAVSVFEGERFVFNHQKEFLQKMWNDLLVKISKTPVDFISSIQDDVCFVLESMKSFQCFDVSKVEELLNTFFTKAAAYDKARSSSSKKLSKGLLE